MSLFGPRTPNPRRRGRRNARDGVRGDVGDGARVASRLTRAFTNASLNSNCVNFSIGGPGSFDKSYAYNTANNMSTGPAGTYAYPAGGIGSVRPHAPTSAGPSTMTYNADGTTASRTTSGVATSYTWTPQDRLASVTTPTSTSTMVYGPGGERVLTKDAAGVHLYLGEMVERHYDPAAVKTTEKRYYTLGSTTIAVRTLDLGDIRGSVTLTVRAGTAVTQSRWYTPWGAPRGLNTTTTTTATTRGYIGQQQDPTGLSYLNNRYYDPATGVFLSVDPLSAQTGTPYLYANGNPTTLADPIGLCAHNNGRQGYDDGKGDCDNPNSREGRRDRPAPPLSVTSPDPVATTQLGDGVIDQIESAGQKIAGDGKLAVGACGDFDLGFVASFSGSGCVIVTADDFGSVETVAAGLGTPKASLSGGLIFSNAQEVADLEGLGGCLSASAGFGVVGGATVCGGLTDDLKFNGIVTVFPSVGIGLEPGGSGMVTVGRTFVQKWGDTPMIVRWFLPDLSSGIPRPTSSVYTVVAGCGCYGSGGQTPYIDGAGVPMAPG
jgi:RHS repeat-associated protein